MEQKNPKVVISIIIMSIFFLQSGIICICIGDDMTLYGILLIICGIVSMFMLCKRNKTKVSATNSGRQSELIEHQLRVMGLKLFEYTLIPTYVEHLKEHPDGEFLLVDVSTWKRNIASVVDWRYIDWDEISCEIFGDSKTECLFLYDFPTPFDIPLAKYGAVYINKRKQIYNYYTLEKSFGGYMLCSPSKEYHANYGEKGDMSKIEFIKEICNIQNIDESSLLQWRLAKSKSSVTEYVDLSGKVNKEFSENNLKILVGLKDDDYEEFITNHPRTIVCFYDANIPSKMMVNLLSEFATDHKDKIAVGIYNVYGDNNEIIRAKMNIMAMPTFLIYKNGVVVQKHIGLCARDAMKTMFENLLL